MDGIEATAAIRAWEKEQQAQENSCTSFTAGETRSNDRNLRQQIPIIALTANAVLGMREMFIENDFNDFIAKPIDVSKLDEMLDRWIPKEKRVVSNEEQNNLSDNNTDFSLYSIPGVDIVNGIDMTGGSIAGYEEVLSMFCRDAKKRLPLLQKIPEVDALPTFITQVHGLKSASSSMGANEISEEAAELEAAGKAQDMAYIREHLGAFAKKVAELVHNIEKAMGNMKPENEKSLEQSVLITHSSLFHELYEALQSQKMTEITRILKTLSQQVQEPKLKKILTQIADHVFMTEFDDAIKIVEELLNK